MSDVVTPDECRELIEMTEAVGYGAAPITTGRGFVDMPSWRNNRRVMTDHRERLLEIDDKNDEERSRGPKSHRAETY